MQVNAAYAEKNLAKLLKSVESGETVTILRYQTPVAQIIPAQISPRMKPKFGTGKHIIKVLDPQWDKAIETEEELAAFLGNG